MLNGKAMRSFSREIGARAPRERFVQRPWVGALLSSVLGCALLGCAPKNERRPEPALASPEPRIESAASAPASLVAPRSHGPLLLPAVDVARSLHPLSALKQSELHALVRTNAASLGSASLGRPNRGWQINAVRMPEGKLWTLAEPKFAWGTQETIEATARAIERVESEHPGSPTLYVGHISRKEGGWLRPHRSHQSGRDVDLGYYYLGGPRWYERANSDNLDRARTWTLLLGLLAEGNVEYVFMDSSVQTLLMEHARSQGAEEAWLAALFSQAAHSPTALVRHRFGHATHLHVRFFSDAACEVGELVARVSRAKKR